jgi:hypothetical protein
LLSAWLKRIEAIVILARPIIPLSFTGSISASNGCSTPLL